MSKKVGFWFYTGDWSKDPELQFCSIFARGLLIDLLCLMFESKRQGELSRPDGSPRSDDEIVDAVRGSTRTEKLGALSELLVSGALKRDPETLVVYSSRLRRLAQESASKKAAGSLGGAARSANQKRIGSKIRSKAVAEPVADGVAGYLAQPVAEGLAKPKQKGGVSDSVSASDSDKNTEREKEDGLDVFLEEEGKGDGFAEAVWKAPEPIGYWFREWVKFRFQKDGQRMPVIQQEMLLLNLLQRGDSTKVVRDIQFSIELGAKHIRDSNDDLRNGGADSRSYGQKLFDSTGI